MTPWPDKPCIYEINTCVWLTSLSKHYKRDITLANVPDEIVDDLARMNVDAVWLMGVWERSPAGRASALNYVHEYRPALPDLTEDDVVGSAYAVGAYEVNAEIGGRGGLAVLRRQLQSRGLKLMLDFVPNHVAVDHPWVTQKPSYMVQGTETNYKKHPGMFFRTRDEHGGRLYIGHGRDPYFPGWIDTAQVNAFSPDYRRAACETLLDIAGQCDGVRCDMAMLMVNEVFSRTWGEYLTGDAPETEFWEEIIPSVKAHHPDFLFVAEVYWGMEFTLLQQGFDFAYDKVFYDRIAEGNVVRLREHLQAPLNFQRRLVRFIENHDEPRAAASLGISKSRAAAVALCTLPGAVLLHDGQLSGRVVKLPVQIKRQPDETPHHALGIFYRRLLAEARDPIYRVGKWRLFDLSWPFWGVDTHNNILAYGWENGDERRLIVANLTGVWSQGILHFGGWESLDGARWALHDMLSDTYLFREGGQLLAAGLYIEVEAFQAHVFHLERVHYSIHKFFQQEPAPERA